MKKEKETPWKVIESEYIARRPWFTARRECVELPNGNRIPEYYILEYPDWVNILAITREGRFVFVRQYRHGSTETSMELCAGVRDSKDCSPLEAARRELSEETGYGGGCWSEYMVLSANPSSHTNRVYTFLAQDVELLSEPHLEPTEDLSVHLLSIGEVRALLEQGEILQALHAAPLWKYMAQHSL